MTDDGVPKKATWLPGGEPEPETEAPVQPHHPDKPRGERQDGAGVAPPRAERNEQTAIGSLAGARGGATPGGGPDDDPFAAHRGEPATGAGESEEPVSGSESGGGREDRERASD